MKIEQMLFVLLLISPFWEAFCPTVVCHTTRGEIRWPFSPGEEIGAGGEFSAQTVVAYNSAQLCPALLPVLQGAGWVAHVKMLAKGSSDPAPPPPPPFQSSKRIHSPV